MSRRDIALIEHCVAAGYGQSPTNCRVLLAEIYRLRGKLREATEALELIRDENAAPLYCALQAGQRPFGTNAREREERYREICSATHETARSALRQLGGEDE